MEVQASLYAPPPLPDVRLPDGARINRYLDIVADQIGDTSPQLQSVLACARPVLLFLFRVTVCVAPLYWWLYSWVYRLYLILPKNVVTTIFGAALCFFGGTYAVGIAAVEAFRQMGGRRSFDDAVFVFSQMQAVSKASDADDKVDADNDGVFDVDQITPTQLAQRKVTLAMRTVDDPVRLQLAVGGLWTCAGRSRPHAKSVIRQHSRAHARCATLLAGHTLECWRRCASSLLARPRSRWGWWRWRRGLPRSCSRPS